MARNGGEPPAEQESRVARALRLAASAIRWAVKVLEGESVQLRAMALTYISLFALVPALVVAFSVVQAFTGMDRLSGRVNEFLFENLAVGARATIEPYLQRFVQNAHLASAGLVGGAILVWSSVSLFSNVDKAVNGIWGIKRRRPIASQAVIYWVSLTLGPILLAGSVMVGYQMREWLTGTGIRFLAVLASALLTCAFFTVLYVIVPYTKVRLKAALAGGLVAGIAWELAKWGYAALVAGGVRYHAIYGSVAAIPIFLLWLYLSWAILLFGARIAFVAQYASSLVEAPHLASKAGREILAGRAMLEVARAFDRGAAAPDDGEIATKLGIQAEDAGEALGALKQAGLVVAIAEGGLVPSRPLEKLSLLDVRRAVEGADPPPLRASDAVAEVVAGVEEESSRRLAATTFRSLCDAPPRPGPRTVAEARTGAASVDGGEPEPSA